MAALTNYAEVKILEHIFRSNTYSKPTLYIGLMLSGTDFEGGLVTEPTANGYARVIRTGSDANWTAPAANGITTNALTIQFPAATGDWGTVNYFGIWDSLTGGNLLIYAGLTTPRSIVSGVNANFAPGVLAFQIDN